MQLYMLLSKFRHPQSYLGKILFVSFLGVHVPLIVLVGYVLLSSPLSWNELMPILVVTLVATLAGTTVTMMALYALLAPVRQASRAIRAYLAAKAVPALPSDLPDEAGRLMADVQEGITRLDSALDAAFAARDEAVEDGRGKFELLSRMSHELRTPLNHIIGFSEVMQNEMLGPLGAESYKGYANDINQSGSDLLGIVQTVLELSQIESGNYAAEFGTVDLADLARVAVSLKHMHSIKAGVTLTLSIQPKLPEVSADQRAAKQMFLQILSGTITRAGTTRIDCTLDKQGASVRFACVADGKPLTRDDIPQAIEGVFAGDAAHLAHSVGAATLSTTGLGLTLTHSLARMHGGTVAASNPEAGGCRIEICFPVSRSSSESVRVSAAHSAA